MSFKQLEKANKDQTFNWQGFKQKIKFNTDGLIPAIAQQHDNGEVLMMAWMDLNAIEETLQTRQVMYWSRSRQTYWRKGEVSGQTQQLKDFRLDCDGDSILLLVDQRGPACHSGRKSCFYNAVREDKLKVLSDPIINPEQLYQN